MTFREADHPRHPRKTPGGHGGEFRDDGVPNAPGPDWADALDARVTTKSRAAKRAPAKKKAAKKAAPKKAAPRKAPVKAAKSTPAKKAAPRKGIVTARREQARAVNPTGYADIRSQPSRHGSFGTEKEAGEYQPGGWEELSGAGMAEQHVAKNLQIYQRLYPDDEISARDMRDLQAFASDAYPDDGVRYFRNGPHLVIDRTTDEDVDLVRMGAHLDRLFARYPPPGPVKVDVFPPGKIPGHEDNAGIHGAAGRGGLHMSVSSEMFSTGRESHKIHYTLPSGKIVGHFMPSRRKNAQRLEYTMSHEYGHMMDFRTEEDSHSEEIFHDAGLMDHLGHYGHTNGHEAYAEAFAEFDMTNGRSRNPAVKAFAQKYGWRLLPNE